LDECIASNWSTRQLERQINTLYYERILSSRDKKAVRKEIHKLEPSLKPEDIIAFSGLCADVIPACPESFLKWIGDGKALCSVYNG
jgi:hypothetical protein